VNPVVAGEILRSGSSPLDGVRAISERWTGQQHDKADCYSEGDPSHDYLFIFWSDDEGRAETALRPRLAGAHHKGTAGPTRVKLALRANIYLRFSTCGFWRTVAEEKSGTETPRNVSHILVDLGATWERVTGS